ncbi:MAG TPA: M1 family aminopeptidase, partial [Candidatus Kryptobacter bacterium]|nr:M1 family aminopeptidase [Candidatus Kryptobacter bacterium]
MRVILAALLIFSCSSFAGQFKASASTSTSVTLHAYDVVKYKLNMDWYKILSGQSHAFNGRMQITFRPSLDVPLDSIRLDKDPAYLRVDSAFSGGNRLIMDSLSGKLTVVLDKPLSAGDTGKVDLYYHVTDPGVYPSPDSLQKGLYIYYKGAQLTGQYTVPETVAYTMSEPSDARYWMPCYDDPSDKALCAISVRVPTGFVAASNGTLDSTIDNGDNSSTFYWSEDYPIATYLMCATAARFSVVKGTAVIGKKSIPVRYYVYPQDSSKAVNNPVCNIDTVISMMKFFSSIYGPYPFDKYGMTGIEPFYYGGMEHQTITTMNRNYEFDRRDVAHELAHQWWGDMVTLGTWKDIWLNESFATYSEAMQLQHLDEASFENEMNFYAARFFQEDSTQLRYPIYAPPTGYIFGLAEYYKGAWVLHMLRNYVGDTTFFAILNRYRTDYEYRNAVTSDFIDVVDSVTNSDMSWFFDEWIFDQGYPVYTKTFSQSGDTVSVTVSQIQTNAPKFRMPMEIGVYSGGALSPFQVIDSLPGQSFKLYFQEKADSVVLDPYNKILARYPGQSLTEVSGGKGTPAIYTLLQNYPNPFNGMTNVIYHLANSGVVTLELFDVLGRKIETLVHGFQVSGPHAIKVNAARLAS